MEALAPCWDQRAHIEKELHIRKPLPRRAHTVPRVPQGRMGCPAGHCAPLLSGHFLDFSCKEGDVMTQSDCELTGCQCQPMSGQRSSLVVHGLSSLNTKSQGKLSQAVTLIFHFKSVPKESLCLLAVSQRWKTPLCLFLHLSILGVSCKWDLTVGSPLSVSMLLGFSAMWKLPVLQSCLRASVSQQAHKHVVFHLTQSPHI